MSATIKDIAEKAGVSVATVSRVLNDFTSVAEETRMVVQEAINELNYKKHPLGKLKTIGLIIPDLNSMFFPTVLKGIEEVLSSKNYTILLSYTKNDPEIEKKAIDNLLLKRVRGVIILGGTRLIKSRSVNLKALSEKLPLLTINDNILGSNIISVMADEINGAYKAINYLCGLGHRKIAFVNGLSDLVAFRNKLEGYKNALIDNNIEIKDDYIVEVDPFEESGYSGTKRIIELDDRPTAIFTGSDQIAIGTYKAIYESGYLIPKDFSVISISNIPISSQLFPELTTIDNFPYKTGKLAAETMIKAIEEDNKQRRILIDPQLVVRNSCRSIL